MAWAGIQCSAAVAAPLIAALVLAGRPAAAEDRASAAVLSVNYRNESIRQVIVDIARASGETFLFDDSLQGRVTMMVPQPVSPEAALELLDAVLLLRGYAVLPAVSGARKIVEISEGAAAAAFERRELRGEPEGLVATMVQLKAARAEQLAAELSHLVSSSDAVVPYPGPNALILAGSESRLHRLIGLARALDRAAEEDLMIRTLRHRSAEAVVEMLSEVFRAEPGDRDAELWADARLNAVIVRASPEQLGEMRSFLEEIDRPPSSQGLIQVLKLRYRDPGPVAEILRLLAKESQGSSVAIEGADAGLVGETLAGRVFNVAVDGSNNALLIAADPDTFALVRQVVEQLDRPRHRIDVTLTVYEVSTPASFELGVNAFIPIGDQDEERGVKSVVQLLPSGSIPTGPDEGAAFVAQSPLVLGVVDENGDPVGAMAPEDETVVITAEAGEAVTRILQRPHLVAMSGEEHELFVGENVPLPVASGEPPGAWAATQTRQQIERHDTGLKLRVKPTLGEESDVRLELDLERSLVKQSSAAGDASQVGPTLLSERVHSDTVLRPGEIAVVGVSRERRREEQETGTPWLKDLPALGWLFRSTSERWVDTRLFIAAEVRVMRSPAEDVAESIRRRLGLERQLARMSGLTPVPGALYALRVDTREWEREVRAIARSLEGAGLPTQVSRWTTPDGRERFDVYATGFETLADAGTASMRLFEAGWKPELVVVPVETSADAAPGP